MLYYVKIRYDPTWMPQNYLKYKTNKQNFHNLIKLIYFIKVISNTYVFYLIFYSNFNMNFVIYINKLIILF